MQKCLHANWSYGKKYLRAILCPCAILYKFNTYTLQYPLICCQGRNTDFFLAVGVNNYDIVIVYIIFFSQWFSYTPISQPIIFFYGNGTKLHELEFSTEGFFKLKDKFKKKQKKHKKKN